MHAPEESPKSGQPNRRKALKMGIGAIGLAVAGGLAYLLGRRENGGMEHYDHEESPEDRQRMLDEMLQQAASFREDPKGWFARRREALLIQGPATYAVECVDEGDDLDRFLPGQGHVLPKNFDVISVPGSGVKYPGFAADLRRVSATNHLMGITSHRNCGACNGDDAVARNHARELAAELGVANLGHVEELQRPSYHVALGANLRYTRKVKNVRFAEDAPRYFDASQWCLSDRAARMENVRLMLDIAYKHGFNNLFLEKNVPFELVIWYDPQDPTFTKEEAASEVREAFPPELCKTKGLLKLTFMEVV